MQANAFIIKHPLTVDLNRMMTDPLPGGIHQALYIRSFSTVTVADTRSLRRQLLERTRGSFTEDEVLRRMPPLNRFSDVIWTVWNSPGNKAARNPKSLLYTGHRGIVAGIPDAAVLVKTF